MLELVCLGIVNSYHVGVGLFRHVLRRVLIQELVDLGIHQAVPDFGITDDQHLSGGLLCVTRVLLMLEPHLQIYSLIITGGYSVPFIQSINVKFVHLIESNLFFSNPMRPQILRYPKIHEIRVKSVNSLGNIHGI